MPDSLLSLITQILTRLLLYNTSCPVRKKTAGSNEPAARHADAERRLSNLHGVLGWISDRCEFLNQFAGILRIEPDNEFAGTFIGGVTGQTADIDVQVLEYAGYLVQYADLVRNTEGESGFSFF